MIKCMFLVYRKPGMSRAEFAQYWSKVHSRVAIETAPAMGMRKYVQNHGVDHPIVHEFQQSRGCRAADFDGIAEAWWDSFDDIVKSAGNLPEDVAKLILEDEARFVDLERSIIFFAEERPFWPVEG